MKKPSKATKSEEKIDTDLVAEICAPIIRRDRHLTVEQVGHILRAAYPSRDWSAAALRKEIADTFNVIVDLPV